MECKFCGKTVPSDSSFKNYCNRHCFHKLYYQQNKTKIHEYQKKYRLKNKEKISARDIEYKNRNKERIKIKNKEYIEREVEFTNKNGEIIILKNKDISKIKNKIYRQKIKNIIKIKSKIYRENNKEKIREKKRKDWIDYKRKLSELPEEKRNEIIKATKQKRAQYRKENKKKIKNHYNNVISKRNTEYRKNNLGECREIESFARLSIKKNNITLPMKKTAALIRLGYRISGLNNCQSIDRERVKEILKAIEEGRTYEAYE